ncbi:MAG TPA: alcohol dehydrogenase catalytic domain-containing protein [Baekduia sp.]|nr:alcohol dehydrogenase catalytic domain-containing protein [Baekduia sp.]
MTPPTMVAARLHEPGGGLRLDEVPVPRPGAAECLVAVGACGICGSDLHLLDGTSPAAAVPVTLGHEASGTVVDTGADVPVALVGRRVAINPVVACLRCTACRRGRPSICEQRSLVGVHRDGAFAEYVCVPAANLIAIPDDLPLAHAALIEPMATPFHALTARAHVRPGDAVAVIGTGGLGLHGVQIARMLGATTIVAVDVDPVARERAAGLGATDLVDPADGDAARAVRRLTGGGADVALECVGRAATVELTVGALRPGGCAAIIGVGDERPSLPPASWLNWKEVDVKGVFAYTSPEMEAVARCLAAGRLDAAAAISAEYPLAEVPAAIQHVRERVGSPVRVLVRPGAAA